MTNFSNILSGLFLFFVLCSSCRKDESGFISDKDTSTCNDSIMKLKRMQSATDSTDYLEAEWNTDGTIKRLTMNLAFSDKRSAAYSYESGRIKEAVIQGRNSFDVDTVVYVYNASGQVDSMYLKVEKDDYNSSIKLNYANNKLTKVTHYMGTEVYDYWDVKTDDNQNIINAVQYEKGQTGFIKESTYTYTRDTKKNPLKDLAVYMLYLDDSYGIFRYWGKNNYTDQRYQAHTDILVDITTGLKYKYNDNCYPLSDKQTISGFVIIDEDAFRYTYY